MTIKSIIEALRELPEDYEVCLSRFFSFPDENPEESFTVVLDSPVVGIMANDENKEARFVLNIDVDTAKNDFPNAQIEMLKQELIN